MHFPCGQRSSREDLLASIGERIFRLRVLNYQRREIQVESVKATV
jgi:hypothetical protein